MIIKALLCLILLVFLPLLAGGFWLGLQDEGSDWCRALAFSFLSGTVTLWAFFQLVAVPMVFADVRLTVLIPIFFIPVILLLLFSMFRQKRVLTFLSKKKKTGSVLYPLTGIEKGMQVSEKVLCCLVVLAIVCLFAFQVYHYVVLHHIDDDDSRFIVTALEAYEHDRMLHVNPATGEGLSVITDDEAKDMCSPWMMYIALLSKLVRLHPAILAHSIYAVVLLFAAVLTYYLMGDELFPGNPKKRNLFLLFAMLVLTYLGGVYATGTFTLTRIWQGKAVLAAIGIPFLLYVFLLLCRQGLRSTASVCLFLTGALALCLLSGMGIIFSGILSGILGVCLLIHERTWHGWYKVLVFCIPALAYGYLYTTIH